MPRKKQSDIEDTIDKTTGGNGVGHNSGLTDDERRALTLHHLGLYQAAEALVEKAKSDRKAIADQAKADLGKGAMGDIKDMIAIKDKTAARGAIERSMRLARWLGLPIGTQISLFDVAVDDQAFEDGKNAGMEGKVCDVPRQLAATSAQRWIAGWHEGQEILGAAFKKLNYVEPPEAAEQAAAQ